MVNIPIVRVDEETYCKMVSVPHPFLEARFIKPVLKRFLTDDIGERFDVMLNGGSIAVGWGGLPSQHGDKDREEARTFIVSEETMAFIGRPCTNDHDIYTHLCAMPGSSKSIRAAAVGLMFIGVNIVFQSAKTGGRTTYFVDKSRAQSKPKSIEYAADDQFYDSGKEELWKLAGFSKPKDRDVDQFVLIRWPVTHPTDHVKFLTEYELKQFTKDMVYIPRRGAR